jgi:hypothetical protein
MNDMPDNARSSGRALKDTPSHYEPEDTYDDQWYFPVS